MTRTPPPLPFWYRDCVGCGRTRKLPRGSRLCGECLALAEMKGLAEPRPAVVVGPYCASCGARPNGGPHDCPTPGEARYCAVDGWWLGTHLPCAASQS
jgi:hypothetical protein